jgi:hypothetical protein
LVKATTLDQSFSVRLDQEQRTLLGAQVQSAIRQGQRALGGLAISPQEFTALEIETGEKTTFVPAVSAIQATVDDDHAAMVVLHVPVE